ncbi:MAG: NUDIX domain-containing protein [Candidatus Saccharimonadales bacterium]
MIYRPILTVDEKDNPIGSASKADIQRMGLWHRIVQVMIMDKHGRYLLQRRSKNVSVPGLWNHSAAGHVDEGEGYLQAAVRETKEELGIDIQDLVEVESWQSNTESVGELIVVKGGHHLWSSSQLTEIPEMVEALNRIL